MIDLMRFFDEEAVINSCDEKDVINNITIEQVVRFLESLGVNNIEVKDNCIICPTICHNPIDEAESMKLYYYDETKNFHCYTECSENFTIFALYQKYMALNHQEIRWDEAVYYVRQFINVGEDTVIEKKDNVSYDFEEVKEQKSIITLPSIRETAIDLYTPNFYHPLWLREGITVEAHDKFNIRFSYMQNKIVIPHYDINGRLVGIRGRAIDEEDLKYGKYRPMQFGEEMFNHQLGFNLYGIWEHKDAIRKTKRVVIYEGEKSVLKDHSYYNTYSVAVATCGSQLNKFQINLLIQELGVTEIILAYDKEYVQPFSEKGKQYRQKLIDKCQKYRGLANFYYLFDEHGILEEKDAPCDKGQEKLEYLMKRRIKVK